jgi:hypothetical protein
MPGAEGPGECPPFAAVFADIDYGVRETAIIDFHVSPLFGKKVHNFFAVPVLISWLEHSIFS